MTNLTSEMPGRHDLVDANELGAWILPISQDVSVAVGRYELKYIEYITAGVTLPGVPAYCEQGFVWRNRFIPALDIHSLISHRRSPATKGEQLAAIVAYENAAGEIDVGAILLRGIPKLVGIAPQQSVEISRLQAEWQLLAQAAFHVSIDSQLESQIESQTESQMRSQIRDTSSADGDKFIDNDLSDRSRPDTQQAILPVLDLRLLFDTTPADLLAMH